MLQKTVVVAVVVIIIIVIINSSKNNIIAILRRRRSSSKRGREKSSLRSALCYTLYTLISLYFMITLMEENYSYLLLMDPEQGTWGNLLTCSRTHMQSIVDLTFD